MCADAIDNRSTSNIVRSNEPEHECARMLPLKVPLLTNTMPSAPNSQITITQTACPPSPVLRTPFLAYSTMHTLASLAEDPVLYYRRITSLANNTQNESTRDLFPLHSYCPSRHPSAQAITRATRAVNLAFRSCVHILCPLSPFSAVGAHVHAASLCHSVALPHFYTLVEHCVPSLSDSHRTRYKCKTSDNLPCHPSSDPSDPSYFFAHARITLSATIGFILSRNLSKLTPRLTMCYIAHQCWVHLAHCVLHASPWSDSNGPPALVGDWICSGDLGRRFCCPIWWQAAGVLCSAVAGPNHAGMGIRT